MATVSVIIIFLDAIDYLCEAVESVRKQTFKDWELILVDDGSSDGSSALARELSAEDPARIRYLDHPGHANLGMSASRNAGVDAARGTYIAFLDSDDCYLPSRLATHVAILEQAPAVSAVQGCLWYWKSWRGEPDEAEMPPLGTHEGVAPAPALLDLLLRTRGGTAPGICSLTVRREVYLQLGGCEPAFTGLFEDQVLWSKLYLSQAVYVTGEATSLYRQRADSTTGKAGEQGLITARLAYLEWLENHLAGLTVVPRTTRALLRTSLGEYRGSLLQSVTSLPDRVLKPLRQAGLASLPAPLAEQAVRVWRQYKHRRHQRRLKGARKASGLPDGD